VQGRVQLLMVVPVSCFPTPRPPRNKSQNSKRRVRTLTRRRDSGRARRSSMPVCARGPSFVVPCFCPSLLFSSLLRTRAKSRPLSCTVYWPVSPSREKCQRAAGGFEYHSQAATSGKASIQLSLSPRECLFFPSFSVGELRIRHNKLYYCRLSLAISPILLHPE